jgi:hypothetical protein
VLLIVVVPVIAILILFVPLSSESRAGKADARLAGALTPTLNGYRDDLASARRQARVVASDPHLGAAIASGPSSPAESTGSPAFRSWSPPAKPRSPPAQPGQADSISAATQREPRT